MRRRTGSSDARSRRDKASARACSSARTHPRRRRRPKAPERQGCRLPGRPPRERGRDLHDHAHHGIHADLSKSDALTLLSNAYDSLQFALSYAEGEYKIISQDRQTFFGAIGSTLTDLFGKDFPTYDATWAEADDGLVRSKQALVAQDVKSAGDQLRQAHDAYEKGKATWEAYKAQLQDSGARAQVGVVVVAVVAVVAVAVVAAAGAAGAAGAGAGAGAGGGAVVGGGVATPTALATTVPFEAAGAGAGAAGAGASPLAASVAPAAAGGATAVGVGGATVDAIVQVALDDSRAALTSGGPQRPRRISRRSTSRYSSESSRVSRPSTWSRRPLRARSGRC
jgi:hypothetical protein